MWRGNDYCIEASQPGRVPGDRFLAGLLSMVAGHVEEGEVGMVAGDLGVLGLKILQQNITWQLAVVDVSLVGKFLK